MVSKRRRRPDIRRINDAKKKETDHPLLDRIYFWVIDRYTKHNHVFKFSDVFVWKGAIYMIPETLSYIIFFALFLKLADISFKKYGDARTVVFFILLLIWRVQVIIKLLGKVNKKMTVR